MMLLLLFLPASSPLDIWHDPNALALMAIGATIVGIAATIWGSIFAAVHPVHKQQKKIEYWYVSDAPIVTLNETMASRIQVLFDSGTSQVYLLSQEQELPAFSTIQGKTVMRPCSVRRRSYRTPGFQFGTGTRSSGPVAGEDPW